MYKENDRRPTSKNDRRPTSKKRLGHNLIVNPIPGAVTHCWKGTQNQVLLPEE